MGGGYGWLLWVVAAYWMLICLLRSDIVPDPRQQLVVRDLRADARPARRPVYRKDHLGTPSVRVLFVK